MHKNSQFFLILNVLITKIIKSLQDLGLDPKFWNKQYNNNRKLVNEAGRR